MNREGENVDTVLLCAFEHHFPDTVPALEASFEHVPDEGAGEVLETNGRTKYAIIGQGTADVLRPKLEPDLTNSHLVAHSNRNGGRSTSAGRGGRQAIPLAVKWIRAGVARERQQQQRGD
jgi:hypothetical protein